MTVNPNIFKRNLGKKQQFGMFSTLASPLLTEVFAHLPFDWILIDTEHSPNEPADVVHQLQVLSGFPIPAIVRPAWSEMVMTKRWLDLGAQTLLFPYVQSAEQAALAVSHARYAPRGIRGVSGASRAAGYGLTPDYFKTVEEELCIIVQIESPEALADIEAIATVDGVDGVFIGPSDLAASMGHLGNPLHPDVQRAVDDGFRRLAAIGKPRGYITNNEEEMRRRAVQGIEFLAIATDTAIIARGAKQLLEAARSSAPSAQLSGEAPNPS